MGTATTHTEGRVVTHTTDDHPSVEVVQLPARDAAVQAAAPPAAPAPPTPGLAKATPAVKAATTQKAARVKKAKKKKR